MKRFLILIAILITNAFAQEEEITRKHSKSAVIHFDQQLHNKTDDNEQWALFNKLVNHPGITVVKFTATWCGPCKAYAPIFDEVSHELKEVTVNGKKVLIRYVSIDTDVARILAQDFNIMSIPSTLFFVQGKFYAIQPGIIKKNDLINYLRTIKLT